MNSEDQQGKSLKYTSETCNLPGFSSLETEGKDVSGNGIYEISNVTKNVAGNQGRL